MMNRAGRWFSKPAVSVSLIVAVCTLLAWKLRFVQDDAFISYRYAANLARGNGLVWNVGERVAGYTNFLWTVLMSLPIVMHRSPVPFSYLVGLTCFVVSLLLTFGIARRLLTYGGALLATLLTGLNYSFALYATGGLETPLVATALLAAFYFALPLLLDESPSSQALLFLSLASVTALLTRLDSAVYLTVLQALVLYKLLSLRADWRKWVALLAPEVVIFAAWCIWQTSYYGELLPNTFYLKIASESAGVRYANGFWFVYQFLLKYLFLVGFLLFAFHLRSLRRNTALLAIATISLAWCAYVIYAGGDFMEYRFMVAVIPLLAILLVWACLQTMRWNIGPVILGLALITAVGPWQPVELAPQHFDVETRERLIRHLTPEGGDWEAVGQTLGRVFHGSPQVTIAVMPAGVIPYYSQLPSVDMLGLNDRWIARHGRSFLPVPGHYRIATLQYLLERRVNLLIQQPKTVPHDEPMRNSYMAGEVLEQALCDVRCELPPSAKLLRIPIDTAHDLELVYVFPTPAVEDAIAQYHYPVRPITN